MLWYEMILALTDFFHPALAAAKTLLDQGDREGSARRVIEHFRRRIAPGYLFNADDLRKNGDEYLLDDAEEVMNHTIYGYTFPGEIDWHFNPTDNAAHNNEWSWSLYRFIFWQPLARAYAKYGD